MRISRLCYGKPYRCPLYSELFPGAVWRDNYDFRWRQA